ncbi:MAG TPA: UDP-N-acetylmuramoyl-L-alanine--D-glutamate ligase [Oscillospiraceae bacterium]|nr:UDP-N-acetylmuramoyl-L-alanine--D-glutamate ligase [Oscillospiraceae bacterium]HPK36241.1 UDP-N-acetylmuramoyl-L-alanine--D-glutamate ligase [Oscillospiraceae bacterium]HPR75491.1 UDP-N-acetylmuramoyl-L-alanine--D-glutamate ligase [Oscillospiraceae bacterium]
MDNRLDAFFAKLRSKKVVIIGIGVSNTPLIKLLLKKGVPVTVCDKKDADALGQICDEIRSWGAKLLIGDEYPEQFDADVIIRAPGVYFDSPALVAARKRGVVVTSEMELFFDYCPCPIYAVTGSDGKTTTTSIIAECLTKQGKLVHLGGNIGRCLFDKVEEMSHNDIAVVELSSFQLMSMRKSPDVAVVTNMNPNHLDIHKDMNEYITAKKNIYLHQNAFGRCVLNAENAITRSFAGEVRGQTAFFSSSNPVENGVYLKDGKLVHVTNGEEEEIMAADEILLPGTHNAENYMAAFAAVWGVVDVKVMSEIARTFKGVEHREEFVRELDGVKYYNDSIATTPTRTIAALNALKQNVILIGGGYDKKIPFEPLGKPVADTCKAVILFGDTAKKIGDTITATPGYNAEKTPIFYVGNMFEAVQKAHSLAKSGDFVTLSPACASFDRYPNYETRGEEYKTLVNKL